MTRTILRGVVSTAVAAAAVVVAAAPRRAAAFTITVNTTNMAEVADGFCALSEAVKAMNMRAPYRGCPFTADATADRIVVPAGTYATFAELSLTRTVEIAGASTATTVLETGGIWGFAARGGSGVNPTVTIRNLTVHRRNDQPLQVMGVFVDGTGAEDVRLVLDHVKVSNCNSTGVLIQASAERVESTFVDILDSTIDGSSGSGLYNSAGIVTITRSVVSNNRNSGIVNDSTSTGGLRTDITISESTIQNNSTTGNGGGIYNAQDTSAQVHVDRSLIAGNHADGDGGGVYDLGQTQYTNTTFSGNSAGARGGGLYHQGNEITFSHATVANNSAGTAGGGIFAGPGGAPFFYFNLVANNTAPSGPDYSGYVHGSLEGDFYNFVRNPSGAVGPGGTPPGFGGVDILNQDPRLGALANLGGLTSVLPLLPGSQAIDRIPSSSFDSSAIDQRGTARPQNGSDGAGRSGRDPGAFEATPATNLALGATATASSQSGSTRTPAMAKDGNTSTRWEASNASSGTWLAMTFSSSRTVSMVTLREFGTRVTSYNVQYRNGSAWTTVATGTSIGAARTHSFSPVSTTAVRLLVNGASAQPSITEFEIY